MTPDRPLAEATIAGLWVLVYREATGVTVLCSRGPAGETVWAARLVRGPQGVRVAASIGTGYATHVAAVVRWVAGLTW